MKKVLYVGLDVDDKAYHGTVYNKETGEYESFSVAPRLTNLAKQLKKYLTKETILKCCYEASYIGFTLYRELNKLQNIQCEVIAPSLIPTVPGRAVKTDRVDATNLAIFYSKELLTPIYVPNEDDERVRDILRSRVFIKEQLKQVRRHLLSVCRRADLHYRQEAKSQNVNHWTAMHITWLRTKIKESTNILLKKNLEFILLTIEQLESSVAEYDSEIEKLCQLPQYKKQIEKITCFRGIAYQSAITLVVEIGDIKRFSHPTKLVSYAGLDIREYSSGGKENKMGISRLGNKFIRTTLVECAQRSHLIPTVGKPLKQRRLSCKKESIDIADRCMKRLHKKGSSLLFKGKPINKIKVACAREMIGFIWEALR